VVKIITQGFRFPLPSSPRRKIYGRQVELLARKGKIRNESEKVTKKRKVGKSETRKENAGGRGEIKVLCILKIRKRAQNIYYLGFFFLT